MGSVYEDFPLPRTFDDLIVPAYYTPMDLWFSGFCKDLWLQGGRNSIKSTFAAYMVALGVMSNIGVNGMVLRKHEVDLKHSVYPNLKQCIQWLSELWPEQRLMERWKFRADCREMIFDGNRSIVFHGLDDPTKRKSEKPPLGGYFGYLWLEELNEFGWEEIKSLRKSVLRGGRIGQSIYTYNPPPSKAAWVNTECSVRKRGRYTFKTTYMDILPYHPEWLGETFIQEAEEGRLNNTIEWRHELMGEVLGTGGEIFNNLEEREITDEQIASFKEKGWDRYGLDFGFTTDPTALIKEAYDPNTRTIYIWGDDGAQGMFEEDIAEMLDKHHLGEKDVVADSAEDRVIAKLHRMGYSRVRKCYKADGWVETGLNFMRSSRRRIVCDSRRAPRAWNEFSKYEYQRYKNGDFHTTYPDKKNHWIDAGRYGFETEIKADYTPKQWALPKAYRRRY